MSEPLTFLNGRVVLRAGDCREVLKGMAENSVDSVVTDPPYHLQSIVNRYGGKNAAPVKLNGVDIDASNDLKAAYARQAAGFMGKQWDGGDIAFQPELWSEVLRVLKPGGYIMAFSGCRTYHRMACAIEDAGFTTHPFFAWAFGSGFPKAHNLSKRLDHMAGAERKVIGKAKGAATNNTECRGDFQSEYDLTEPSSAAAREWDGWFYGTQSLKPALEPIYFGQKPFERGLNGAQNILKWGVGAINVVACKVPTEPRTTHARGNVSGKSGTIYGNGNGLPHCESDGGSSRWPANLIHDGSEEVLACFPETHSAGSAQDKQEKWPRKGNSVYGTYDDCGGARIGDDSGSPARFFASFPQDDIQRIFYTSKAGTDDRLGSRHPTVKPISLLRYLARLITPPNGMILDIFAGTGTLAEAAYYEGFRATLIEREDEYQKDIIRRLSLIRSGPDERSRESLKANGRVRNDPGPLFAVGEI